jgi:hypothetical protein
MAQSGNSSGDQSDAKPRLFRPRAEVAAKMQPLSRTTFEGLLRRAATVPALQLHPKAK